MGAATVVQSSLRRGSSIKMVALIAVLGAAVATMKLRHGRHHHHCHHGHMVYVPTPRAAAPAPVEQILAPTDHGDPCPAALAAWAAVRNEPDVPSGTVQQTRTRLRNLAIEACRAPHQP